MLPWAFSNVTCASTLCGDGKNKEVFLLFKSEDAEGQKDRKWINLPDPSRSLVMCAVVEAAWSSWPHSSGPFSQPKHLNSREVGIGSTSHLCRLVAGI